MECNSTISPFLGRWQNLTESQKKTHNIHKTAIEIEKNFWIHKQYMYMNYKDGKKIHLSLLSLFVIRTRKEGRRKKLEIRMFTNFSTSWISTRRGMDGKVKNAGCNDVVLCRRETSNSFKIVKELNKKKSVSSWNMRSKKTGELWKKLRDVEDVLPEVEKVWICEQSYWRQKK